MNSEERLLKRLWSTISIRKIRGGNMLERMVTIRKTGTADLSSVALALSTTHPGRAKLLQVLLRASVAISETVTVTFDSKDGSTYDVVLDTSILSSASSYVFRPTGECVMEAGDVTKVECTKANNTGIVYVTILLQDLGKA